MSRIFEEDTELILHRNPKGGKPQKIGATVSTRDPYVQLYEISDIKEDCSLRYFLGYCACGRKVVAGEKRVLILMRYILATMRIESFEVLRERVMEVMKPLLEIKKGFWDM
jgi:hypothetical protein